MKEDSEAADVASVGASGADGEAKERHEVVLHGSQLR